MIEIGQKQKLSVIKKTDIGVYLNSRNNRDEKGVLLPRKQVPQGTELGDTIEVFVYKDSEDRLIATTDNPMITIDETAYLEVVQETKIGAFLDWGLPKDLFLPFKEQNTKIKKGKKYLVGLYLDKSERLCATMKVNSFLEETSPYKENDRVKGTIYSINEDIGAFVAVDNKYDALIPMKELSKSLNIGDQVEARVTKVKEDGKLDLSIREKAYKQMDSDAKIILDKLDAEDGILFLNDSSSPEEIKDQLNISKNAFKRAVGRLLKEKKIEFVDNGIRKI